MSKGLLYLILASLCYAAMSIFIRLINTEIPPFSQMFLRYFVTVSLSVIFVIAQKQKVKPYTTNDFFLLIAIAFFGYTLSTVFFTFSILETTIATALFLFSTNVIITPILAFVLLKEKISQKIWISMIIAICGASLLFQPDFQSKSVVGPLCALIASFVTAIYYVGRRKLQKYSAATMMLYATITGLISMAIAAYIFEPTFIISGSLSQVSIPIWITMFLFACDNFIAWYFVNKGFESINAGPGSIILLLEPVIGVLIGITLYSEIPTTISFIGIFLIIGSILIAARKV